MGSNLTSGNQPVQAELTWGNATITFDKSSYTVGDTISGEVNAELESNQDKGEKNITIFLICQEKLQYRAYPKGGSVLRTTGDRLLTRCHSVNVKDEPSGQYKVPFSFTIPGDTPGSYFDKFNDDDGESSIKYAIQVEIESTHHQLSAIKVEKEVFVRAAPPIDMPMKNVNSVTEEHNVNAFCCINKGQTLFRIRSDKPHYLPGEEALIFTEIDNSRNTVGVLGIKCSLVCYIKYTYYGMEIHDKIIEMSHVIQRMDVGPGVSASGSSQKVIRLPILAQNPDQNTWKPSTKTKYLECVYNLRFDVAYDGFGTSLSCSTRPFQFPVFIYPLVPVDNVMNPDSQPVPIVSVSIGVPQFQQRGHNEPANIPNIPGQPTMTIHQGP